MSRRRAYASAVAAWLRGHLGGMGLVWAQAPKKYGQPCFWNARYGVLVGIVDARCRARDAALFSKVGIDVVRVRAFHDGDIARVRQALTVAESWEDRRRQLGIREGGGDGQERDERPPGVD